ncbi:hypothetical protein Tcan_03478 [Toxocara canis]|uniref:Uncharacterized protein n=1 Tax=Toxocara canis TaxID=6265 RepID=A0A0B2VDN5_TOXCA|nr:hypothetical protein Tcan_03478 [Toxocara canis]
MPIIVCQNLSCIPLVPAGSVSPNLLAIPLPNVHPACVARSLATPNVLPRGLEANVGSTAPDSFRRALSTGARTEIDGCKLRSKSAVLVTPTSIDSSRYTRNISLSYR